MLHNLTTYLLCEGVDRRLDRSTDGHRDDTRIDDPYILRAIYLEPGVDDACSKGIKSSYARVDRI